MEKGIQTLNDVTNAILHTHETDVENGELKVVNQADGILVLDFNGILVTAQLTEEDVPRLRMSADVCRCDAIEDDTDIQLDVFTELLDLNTEIDPVQVALDTSDPENAEIVALNSIRVISLQTSEVEDQFNNLVYTLPLIADVMRKFVATTA